MVKAEVHILFFPVSVPSPTRIYPDVRTQAQIVKQELYVDQIRPQPPQPLPQRDDDWFVLFDAVREKAVIIPTGIQLIYVCTQHKTCALFTGYASVTQLLSRSVCASCSC